MNLELKSLIERLNATCRKALETAAGLCVAQTHYNVEIEHVLLKLLEMPDTDLKRLLHYYLVGSTDVTRELTRTIETFQRGNGRTPALSPQLVDVLQEAWLLSSLQLGTEVIRSGALLLALLEHPRLREVILTSAPILRQIPTATLKQELWGIVQGSEEDREPRALPRLDAASRGASRPSAHRATASHAPSSPSSPGAAGEPAPPAAPATTLDQFTIDLTAQAKAGQIDPIRGRDAEIRQIVDILMRRRQNNPILTGEAGVGKTAVVEGFALRIAAGDVPPPLRDIVLRVLDLGLLQAGAGVRGEFENRLKQVIAEVKASPQPIILFIDEAHTLIGAGNMAGQGDAANLLKPALARGELRTIAATTWSEYKRYFEKDPALARRFQVVKVEEPDEVSAVAMLRGVAANLEAHHNVRILDEAIRDAVTLSHRYISGRQLPDKAIGVLDTACARVAIGQNGTPPAVEDAIRRMENLEIESTILRREQGAGDHHAEQIAALDAELTAATADRAALEARWHEELELVQQIRQLQQKMDAAGPDHDGHAAELAGLEAALATMQGDEPMVPLRVDGRVIASVISGWTGVPVGRMLTDEIHSVLNLKESMARRIIGQSQALDIICRRLQTAGADLDEPGKPVGVFLLVGPSGVGKTETAIALADLLYGGERSMVVVNMSEYQEAHTVSGLKGSPPGYVGFGTGGVLTEAVRHTPYSVVLLDEVEKAHSDVLDLFYQVFDKGTLEDGEGIVVDFKNTIILLTCNLGAEAIVRACQQSKERPDAATLVSRVRPALLTHFKPALLGRLVIVPYMPLNDEEISAIVRLKLARIQERFQEAHRAALTFDEALPSSIAERCTDLDSGARTIDHLLTQTLLPELSGVLLERMARGEPVSSVHVSFDDDERFVFDVQE